MVDPRRTETARPRLRARRQSHPAAIRTCCSGCCTRCSPRTWSTSAGWRRRCAGSSALERAGAASGRSSACEPAGRRSRRRRSRGWPASSRARRARRGLRPGRGLPAADRDHHPLADQRAEHRLPGASTCPGARCSPPRRSTSPRSASGSIGRGSSGDYRQRVSGLPSFVDELPVAGLADEILTPGAGQVRGMVAVRRQPGALDPGRRAARCGDGRARVVRRGRHVRHRDLAPRRRHPAAGLPPRARRHRRRAHRRSRCATTSASTRPRCPSRAGGRTDWEILMGLAARIGRGRIGGARNRALRLLSPALGRRAADRPRACGSGPYGLLRRGPFARPRPSAGSSGRATASTSARSSRGCPGILRTPGKRIELAPPEFVAEAARARGAGRRRARRRGRTGYDLVLIGRRQLRSNNSWMHNSPRLMKGGDRCTALLHPDDAAARGLGDGQRCGSPPASGRSRCRSRSPTRCAPGWSRSRTASATAGPGSAGGARPPCRGRASTTSPTPRSSTG